MQGRFIIPDNIDPKIPTLFAVVDSFAMAQRQRWDIYRFADAFGVAFNEVWQLFGYKVASIPKMTEGFGESDLVDFGGYYYYCFKTLKRPMGKLLLTDGTDLEKKGTEFIGWGYHSSRYYPYAIEQAMYSTYKEALNEVKKIQAETNMPMAEIMHKELARDLETSDYTKWGIDPLASEPQIPASTKRKTHKSFCCLCDFASDLVACSMTERQEHVEDNRCIYAMRNKKRVSVVRGGVVEMNRKTYRRKLNGDLGEEVKLERRNQLLMYSITGKHD